MMNQGKALELRQPQLATEGMQRETKIVEGVRIAVDEGGLAWRGLSNRDAGGVARYSERKLLHVGTRCQGGNLESSESRKDGFPGGTGF